MSFSVKPSSIRTNNIFSDNPSTVANNNVTRIIPYRVSSDHGTSGEFPEHSPYSLWGIPSLQDVASQPSQPKSPKMIIWRFWLDHLDALVASAFILSCPPPPGFACTVAGWHLSHTADASLPQVHHEGGERDVHRPDLVYYEGARGSAHLGFW